MLREVLCLAAVTGCGFQIAGAASDARTVDDARSDVLPLDVPPSDGAADAAGCTPITTGVAGVLTAPRIPTPTIDGSLAEWATCFVTLDVQTAGLVRNFSGMATLPASTFTVGHDGTRVYVAARIEGVPPLGTHATEPYRNDSLAAYLDADGATGAGYGGDTKQIVVDHQNLARGYRDTVQSATPALQHAAVVEGDARTFTVEMGILPSTIDATGFAATIGFTVGINGGDGVNQEGELVWFQKCNTQTGCQCQSGDSAPYCDSRQFGALTLAP